jgi:hypothetical protein
MNRRDIIKAASIAADNGALRQHVEILVIPLPGGTACGCVLEDQVRCRHTRIRSHSTADAECLVEDLLHRASTFVSTRYVLEY